MREPEEQICGDAVLVDEPDAAVSGQSLLETVVFFDLETEPGSRRILDFGAVRIDGQQYHTPSQKVFIDFIRGAGFLCGHNVFAHDLKYLDSQLYEAGLSDVLVIDTLQLSPLLFPKRPYHKLLKDDKLQVREFNNPLNDAKKSMQLLCDEVAAFSALDAGLQQILLQLLYEQPHFSAFFKLLGISQSQNDLLLLIQQEFAGKVCAHANVDAIARTNPVELAYCLSLIHSSDSHSITPPWVFRNYPEVERIMYQLRNQRCQQSCDYCSQFLDAVAGLKRYFGFDSFRSYGGVPLQEQAVSAVLQNDASILAIFPTGGGKSITFQVPALIAGETARALTVVISPLQSLMKDQVDNLESRQITDSVTINGLLDPIERRKAYERVEDGSASILYLSPESLRSQSIERLLHGRNIARFVIDEAHCFSAWGQDFRVDYLYIGDFIRSLQNARNNGRKIPVSCFTATARPQVVEDIKNYFREKLAIELQTFTASGRRQNLKFKVVPVSAAGEKYAKLRDLLESRECPAIVYVSRTRKAVEIAEKLSQDGVNARPYHGKMDGKEKTLNQNEFISGRVRVIVATSAFGMGVDKPDVGLVIHYDISDSLENYIQEAGRAARDAKIDGDCYVLFDEEDLSKHFILLNQTKVNLKEIQQIWKAIKDIMQLRSSVSSSALEIARKAGWDDGVREIETRVITAVAALEDAGFIKRGQNNPRVYANSIQVCNAEEARNRIQASARFRSQEKEKAIRIMVKLIAGQKRANAANEDGETRIDYISDHLGIGKSEVIRLIYKLREDGILGDEKDLSATVKFTSPAASLKHLNACFALEKFLLRSLVDGSARYNFKELNEKAAAEGLLEVTVKSIKTIVNFWAIKGWVKQSVQDSARQQAQITLRIAREKLEDLIEKRQDLATFIMKFFREKKENSLKFSIGELKKAFAMQLIKKNVSDEDIEDALFFLSRLGSINIEGGFMVIYNRLKIERIEQDNRRKFRQDHYQKLENFYANRVQQIHIVGEYARLCLQEYQSALQFVEDYFSLPYEEFLAKHFPGARRDQLSKNITPQKFAELFGSLSTRQLEIVHDKVSKVIVVAAGPGSGKTWVLTRKLASLMLMENIKQEQLLMLTFSRAAATEFKKRLLGLIGNAVDRVEIKTFHSYCFDLLGKVGSLADSDKIVAMAVAAINSGEVELSRITKMVLVIDEAQDISDAEFSLIEALINANEDMRLIAVGDDDQNIFEFRGSSSEYMKKLLERQGAGKYELTQNYRSSPAIVDFANGFAANLSCRLKTEPLVSCNQEIPGQVLLTRYTKSTGSSDCPAGDELVLPLVKQLMQKRNAGQNGSFCVLTCTNFQTLQVHGLLKRNGLNSRLIQSNDGFRLENMTEIRDLIAEINAVKNGATIYKEAWNKLFHGILAKHAESDKLHIVRRLLEEFAAANPTIRYKSDLLHFIRESGIEDFLNAESGAILVSTIHKAKGKEFDNVYLLIDGLDFSDMKARRQFYVGITRAKSFLSMHYAGNGLSDLLADNEVCAATVGRAELLDDLILDFGLRDVYLDSFFNCQNAVARLVSGSELRLCEEGCKNSTGEVCVRFSKQGREQIEDLAKKGFKACSAKVNFIVHWKKDKEPEKPEIKIVLPQLLFKRSKRSENTF